MRAIVTGGAGFIGQALVKKLLKENCEVIIIDWNTARLLSHLDDYHGAIIRNADVRDFNAFTGFGMLPIDYVFHLAAPSSIILFNEDEQGCLDITIRGFLNAINFCALNDCKLIYPSTGSLYAGAKLPNKEDSKLNLKKINSYARAKLALEHVAFAYKNKCKSLGLRIFAGYGNEEHKGEYASVVYSFIKSMCNKKAPVLFGDGTQTRDFIYIDDLADAIFALKDAEERIINVGSGVSTEFNRIVKGISNHLHYNCVTEYTERPSAYLEQTHADITLMRKYYTKKLTNIDQGIKKIISNI